ncbi:hypothetical protein [Paenibacillus caui]|uniref:hypothetical protein n=1 Tax=Paenibacillus caui TaxID=2873927 RepID=UPI0030809D2D
MVSGLQLSEAEQLAAGVSPELIRLSVGTEGNGTEAIDDIIDDVEQAIQAAAVQATAI